MRRLRWPALACLVLAVAGPARATTITFDDLPAGTLVDTEYQSLGVTFSGGTRTVALAGTSSAPNALTGRGEDEFDPAPITISFSASQSRVAMKVGLDSAPGFSGTATLTGYRWGGLAVDSDTVTLGPGQTPVTAPLEVQGSGKWSIDWVVLEYPILQFEVLDDLEFGATGTPPPANETAPLVDIQEPRITSEPTPTGMVILSGAVIEDAGLASLTLSIGPSGGPPATTYPIDWSEPEGDSNAYTFGPMYVGPLQEGRNTLTVRAEDLAGNVGQDSADVFFEPPPEGVNLYAQGLEVTQAMQTYVLARAATRADPLHAFPSYFYGSAPFPSEALGLTPLVRGKPTVVRLYPGVEGIGGSVNGVPAHVDGVPARLYGFRDGAMLPGSPLLPSQPTITVSPSLGLDGQRADASASWNFLLPSEWTAGASLVLRAEVNPLGDAFRVEECAGCNDAANAFAEVRVSFAQTGAILIRPYLVEWTGPSGTRTFTGDLEPVFRAVRAAYPVAPWSVSVLHYQGVVASSGATCQDILADFQEAVWEGSPVPWSEPIRKDVAYGVLPAISVAIEAGGCAYLDGRSAVGVGDSVWMAPHELGHSFGLIHASCAHDAGRDGQACEADWPWGDGEIGALGFDVTGVSSSAGRVVPMTAYDFMSYGSGDHWVSPLTYSRLFEQLALSGASRPAAVGSGPYLLVRGRVAGDGSAVLDGARRVDGPADSLPREGSATLVLLGGDGTELASRSFEPPDGGGGIFLVTLPFVAGAERVELRRGAEVLASLGQSGHAPTVRLLEPNGGERFAAKGVQTVRWRASDGDGDPLRFRLQYSADGGTTWRTVAAGLEGSSHRLDLAGLEGSAKAKLRVLADDGFDTASDASDRTFRVAAKRPRVTVLFPAGGVYPAGVDVPLAASALDLEDGNLAGSRLSWSSSLDGSLGTGAQVTLRAPSLGRHVVTVRAVDRSGAVATAKVAIQVTAAAVADAERPTLSALSPRPGAKGVARAARVSAIFSEEVVGVCARHLRLLDASRKAVPARVSYDRATGAVTVVPLRPLAVGTAYRVVLSARITDLAGNPARQGRWVFRTA